MIKSKPRFGSELGAGITPFVVLSNPATYRHQIYIQNNLEQQEEMIAVLDVLYSAAERDEVIIHLNCDGGNVNSLDTLLTAMSSCAAMIHVIATGTIASAATFILLAADSFEISPFTTLLFHTVTFGVYGQSQDNLELTQFIHAESERLMRSYYEHIFTEEEINDIIVNKRQKYLTSAEFSERFEAAKIKAEEQDKKEREEAEQEMKEALEEMYASPPKEVLAKLTKAQLISYINDEIYIDIKPDGSYDLIDVE